MYELKKKLGRYLRVNLLGPGPRLMKKKNLPGHGPTGLQHGFLNCGTCTITGTPKIIFHYAASLRFIAAVNFTNF